MHMWHHVTNHLIISNDKDSNSENRIKLRVRDTVPIQSHPGVGMDVLFLMLKDDSDICCTLGLSSRGRSLELK
jgi:hypothetical protein